MLARKFTIFRVHYRVPGKGAVAFPQVFHKPETAQKKADTLSGGHVIPLRSRVQKRMAEAQRRAKRRLAQEQAVAVA